ncbi:MAG: YdcF family protein [Chitinophagales bacterium]|nr:YdcF family protein [Chitinophagaceae bacterium]MCB9065596.1 YdcF family protein [Chitinophagales bacterium]
MKNASLFFIVVTIFLVGCISLKRGPNKAYNQVKEHNLTFDAIIVPGIPYDGKNWDTVMKARVIWSWILYKNGVTKNIIYSGSAVYSPYYESKVMGLYAEQLGIPKEHIFYDTIAKHSTENVFYSYLVAKQNGFKRIALTTDPFQSALLQGYTRTKMSTPVYHMPFVIDSLKVYNNITPSIDPEPARKKDFVSITNQEPAFKRFMGTMGGDIDWSQYKDKILPPL